MKKGIQNKTRIAIMGGGAGGMAAAISAAGVLAGSKIATSLFETDERLGKKLLATGNGRCNFGNLDMDRCHYHGADPDFVIPAFTTFPVADNIAFFQRLGIPCRQEDGKLYPYSNQGAAVLDALRLEIQRLGIDLHCGCRVTGVQRRTQDFLIETEEGKFPADRFIVAAGGMAGPDLGGGKSGYQILEALEHPCTPLFPALVQIKTEHPLPKALRGIKIKGRAILCRKEKEIAAEAGEILFTDYGLSGPPILQLSRKVGENRGQMLCVHLDFMPDFDEEAVQAMIRERRDRLGHLSLEYFLIGIVNKKAGMLLIKHTLNRSLASFAETLTDAECRDIAAALKRFSLPVAGTLGWKHSQVTAGGIATAAFDPQTLESRRTPGLYAAGEVLDIDGDCGGFNLQWAWSSGRLAGLSAARSL